MRERDWVVADRLRLFETVSRETGSIEDAMWAVLQEHERQVKETRRGERIFLDPAPEKIIDAVCQQFTLTRGELLAYGGRGRRRGPREPKVIRARWVAMKALREHGYSLPVIGMHLNRHHTTVMHGLAEVSAYPSLCRLAVEIEGAA